ncbi:hypothetical protein J2X02_000825 [Pseudoxanthomonas japonensis]|uniref:hypothetical protein n=1 Tax=Pseudoxanthomonas TaxID=83618 RepID=UPI000783231C|nr:MULTISPECIES: hypothetical protein [Pseudoxanthomonas]MBL8256998.1 hypothetical protein [Pseudoxanthomonas mexicana]MDR7068008.1 hypothetical protein [Pseudoxanthomonas japonensis]
MNSQTSPQFTENPAPRQAYRLTLRIEGAPGPLEVVSSAAQYDVVNKECLPPPKDNPGGHTAPVPTHDIPFRLERVSDNEYAGIFHTDGMVDAEYHGRGVCRWELIQAQVQLRAPGDQGDTYFIAKLSGDELPQGAPKAFHYWKARYPKEAGAEGYRDFGQPDLQKVPEDQRDEFFGIVLTARET